MSTIRPSFLAYLICILGATFYVYEFCLQVSISVMTNQVMAELALNAATLGLMSSCFYYAYTFMQVPAGLLHDRFGPHKILTLAILVCSLGALLFSYSHNILDASLARFLMGIGAACSFTGALILITHWFPIHYFPVLSGLVQFLSAVGAIFGEVALSRIVNMFDWRPTMYYLALFGFLLAVLVFLIVRDYPKGIEVNQAHTDGGFINLKFVMRRTQSWWIAIYSFLVWAPIAAFAALWGIPFLMTAYHMTTEQASFACSAIWIGIGIGSPAIGFISEYMQKRCVVLAGCALSGLIGSTLIIYFSFPLYIIIILLFLLGWGGSGQSLAFSVVRDVNPSRTLGAAIGLNNMATVAGGAIFQPFVGLLLHLQTISSNGSVPIYTLKEYQNALFIIPLCYFLAAIISLYRIKETRCQIKYPL